MAFDFGSQTLGIRNPFKTEGALVLTRGLVVALLGFYCLFRVAGLVDAEAQIEAWLNGGVGLVMLIYGVAAIGTGLFKVFRFYVGRNVPASLAFNHADPTAKHHYAYKAKELHDMLMARKNTTFREPESMFSRFVHTLIPRLLYMPPTYRALAENLMYGLGMTVLMLMVFGLAWFSAVSGLTDLQDTPVMAWLGSVLTVYLVLVWFGMRKPLRHFSRGPVNISLSKISLLAGCAVLLPVALAYVHKAVMPIPNLPLNPAPVLLITLALAAVTCVLVLFLLFNRMAKLENPLTEVSEHRDNWQKSIVPRELFIRLDAHILANRRHQEIPNRDYQSFEPQMIEEGGSNKGSFKGRTLVETQPIFKDMQHSAFFKLMRLLTTALGQLMLAAAAIYLVTMLDTLTRVQTQPELLMQLAYPLLLLIFGQVISNSANAFWAEMQFNSVLLDLSVEGTYTESKLSTGQSIYDSTRSENTVVRSTITPWFLLSNMLTTTFAHSGRMNLEQRRYVMSFSKGDDTLAEILEELQEFFDSREAIAGINEVDLNSASQIFQMNEQTRAKITAPSSTVQIEAEQAAGLLRKEEEGGASESKGA